MWIIMKKTYSGALGLFPKGMKYDLPESKVEQLPKRSYKESVPPWEEHTDTSAIELAAARKTASNNLALVGILETAIEKANAKTNDLLTIAEGKEAEVAKINKAYNEAARAAEKKDAKALDKAKAFDMAHEANIKAYELEQAQGRLRTATAEGALLQLDLQEARRAVEKDSEQQPTEPEQQQAETEQTEPTMPTPPQAEDIGEAEIPKEVKTDGPKKDKNQQPKRTPPKKR